MIFAPSEIAAFFLTKDSLYLYVPIGIYQNIASVGINLAFANLIYMNLPKENSTAHLTFYTIGANAFKGCFNSGNNMPCSIYIPASVDSIGAFAFYGCVELSEIRCGASSKPATWDSDWNVKLFVYQDDFEIVYRFSNEVIFGSR